MQKPASEQVRYVCLAFGTGVSLLASVGVLPGCDTAPRLPQRLETLAPKMLSWFERTESRLLEKGRPLTESELSMARSLGVRRPERVRVVVTPAFPMPRDSALRKEAGRLGFDDIPEAGRAMGHAILLLPSEVDDRETLAHELIHVAQAERMGKEAFLRAYFASLSRLGYSRSRFEREARTKAARYRE